jgi:hypothetical protein
VQTALSQSFKYNTGTVNNVKLTAEGTNVNDALYYVTADGGSHWDNVSNGIQQAVTVSGTDLRWFATNTVSIGATFPTPWGTWGLAPGDANPVTLTSVKISYS